MCRSSTAGGRRCPGCRGEKRRAYQRQRYAARKAALVATATTDRCPPDQLTAAHLSGGVDPDRVATAAAVDTALAALRDPTRAADPATEAAYAAAVLAHGEVLRRAAAVRIDAEYRARGLDDDACQAEADAIKAEVIAAHQRSAQAQLDPSLDSAEVAVAQAASGDAFVAAATRLVERSEEINIQRAAIARDIYYEELAKERSFGGVGFEPSNHAKLTRADRALFANTVALYPDEMVAHAESLGPMLAKRSKARAHYNAGARQRRRRTRAEIFDLTDATAQGRLRFAHLVESVDDVAAGGGSTLERHAASSMFLPRTPENEARLAAMVERRNAGQRKPVMIKHTTVVFGDNPEPREALYVQGPQPYVDYVRTGVSAELTYSDGSSMAHELGHRMEDRNPEIAVATKAFLARRTEGLPAQRYSRTERVVPDDFAHVYIGKDYPGTPHTEIFSCGMEAVAHGGFGGLQGRVPVNLAVLAGFKPVTATPPAPKADSEHLALVLGLLASANKRIA